MNLQGMSRRRSQDGLGNIAELNVEYPNVGHLIIDGIYVSTRRESRKARSTEQDSMFWTQCFGINCPYCKQMNNLILTIVKQEKRNFGASSDNKGRDADSLSTNLIQTCDFVLSTILDTIHLVAIIAIPLRRDLEMTTILFFAFVVAIFSLIYCTTGARERRIICGLHLNN